MGAAPAVNLSLDDRLCPKADAALLEMGNCRFWHDDRRVAVAEAMGTAKEIAPKKSERFPEAFHRYEFHGDNFRI